MFSNNRLGFLFSFIFINLLFISSVCFSQDNIAQTEHTIHLKTGNITPIANTNLWVDSIKHAGVNLSEPLQVLMHFNKLPNNEQKALLAQKGITLLDYLPANTYITLVDLGKYTDILSPSVDNNILLGTIHSITNLQPEWKIDAFLLNKIDVAKQQDIAIMVSFYPMVSENEIKAFIANEDGKLQRGNMEKYGCYKIVIPASKIRSLASWYGVKYISIDNEPVPCDLQSRPAVRGNVAVTSTIFGGYGLLGDGVVVGVGDNSSGIYHADMKDRITNFNPGPISHHGEHVNGIVGSAAIIDPLAESMAPHVSLIDYLFDLILPETGAMYHDYQMNITNNSYAVILGDCNYAGTYDVYAQFIDTLAMQFPYVLHVFASGNDGGMNCSPYLQGFGTVAGGYQPAKNNMTVGSYTDFLVQAGDESRGPTKDGRIKPEIVATGLGAYSTINVDGYEWAAGTSMASPQAAGGLAVITQRFKQMNSNELPNSDLLKALALNGALDLGNPGPDYSYGFGGMDVARSLKMIDSSNYFRSSVTTGDSQIFYINVPPNTAQLKVMICWNDPPANPMAATQLVNDIDLTVKDTSNNIHFPLVLDPTPANVNNYATERPDHLNNTEQVTITNPTPGAYLVNIKGYNIPVAASGTQPYALVYDIIPAGVLMTFPLGGEQLDNVDSIRIFWDGVTDTNTYNVQYSTDSGNTWVTINNNVPPTDKHSDFVPPAVNSGNCLVQVARNGTGQITTSGRFCINRQPVVVVDTAQCPGYINIHWSPIPNATAYMMLAKKGFYMQVIDSVTDTFYSFKNMSLTERSYVAIQPVINGMRGYRSVAAIVVANTGNCTNTVSTGDLMLEKIIAPTSGRMFTSTQLKTNENLTLKVKNLYNVDCNNYTVSYQINSGSWQSISTPATIYADSFATISIPGLDLSAIGTYTINVFIHNLQQTDNNPLNDTLNCTVLNIPNDTLNLINSFTDSFETMSAFSLSKSTMGISPNWHWDYFNANDTGRLRTFVSEEVTFSGHRSISLDESQCVVNGSHNAFEGTFNLSNFDTAATEIRIDFDYMLHGTPKSTDGNIVSVRAIDTMAWQPLFSYNLSAYPGYVTNVRSLSLTDAMRQGKRNFSSSTQVSFGQNDTSLIAAVNYGNGITLDNFRLYTVANDVQLVGIINPLPTNCGLPLPSSLTVQVHNGVNHTLFNVLLYYNLDGGLTYAGNIDSIKAKDTINYTFSQPINLSLGLTHTLNVWLTETGDTYHANDSIMNYKFRNSRIIGNYPYLENFESGDGGYFSDGFKNSWQYGTPASKKINKAASGNKAWKTNLSGNYNNLEKSYLYSPCFDLSSLTNPMLSFSAALDIENCGNTMCDQAYIEYSFDGLTYTKLGSYGQGTNWYDATFDVWNTEGFTRWHVASIPLPKPPLGEVLHLRFAMVADPGTNFEGFAVDDIHIFGKNSIIMNTVSPKTISLSPTGNNWYDFSVGTEVAATLNPNNQTLGNTTITKYPQVALSNPAATQYTFSYNYSINLPAKPTTAITTRLYLTEQELMNGLNDTTCPSCTPLLDAYSLGVTQYDDNSNPQTINGTLTDDTSGTFTYYPYKTIQWVPYDNGYYAQFNTQPNNTEFWFNDGGPTGNFAAGEDYINFNAVKSNQDILLNWYSLIDTSVYHYILERSVDGINFTGLLDTASSHTSPAGQYTVIDWLGFGANRTLYYRLKWTMTGNAKLYYSPFRVVNITDSANNQISFDATQVNHTNVLLNWQSMIDGIVSYYILERAIDNSGYSIITSLKSKMQNAQNYYFTDEPAILNSIANAIPLHYRLTAILTDSSKVVLPVKTINWMNNNSLIKIYPNPIFDGKVNLLYNAETGTTLELNITDITGRIVYQAQTTATNWSNKAIFTTFIRPTGIYFVRIVIGDQSYMVKMEWE